MSIHETHFFPNSQGNTLNNATLLHVEGDYIQNPSREGITGLRKTVATDAFHDSIDRSTLKCHPGTRENLIKSILSWIKQPKDTGKDILWIHGPTGSGKSTVMQTIAEICFNCAPGSERRHPGGTFFFSRGKSGRDSDRCLFATLSYSLTQTIPAFQDKVNQVMVTNPIITLKDPHLQLQKLIFEPLEQIWLEPCKTPFVIIDGLDECNGHDVQRRILESIQTTLRDYGPHLRFIITARREAHIREIFDLPHFKSITTPIPLNDSFDPKNDIRLYLEQSFEEIARRKGRKTQWFQTSDIDYLVEKSSGQFLYAATVVKFLGTDLKDPAKQLKIVLKPSQPSPSIFANIGELYTQILETIPEKETLLRIFSLLLTMHCPQPPEVYDDILGLEPGDTTFILRGLHSVIRYPTSDDKRERQVLERRLEYDKTRGLRFHHASFQDFLLDKELSKDFFVDISNAHAGLVDSGFRIMKEWISSPWSMSEETNPPDRETWGYLKHHIVTHLAECKPEVGAAMVEGLLDFQLSFPPPTPIENDIWDHAFHALHSMVTAFALILDDHGKEQVLGPTNFHSEHSHWAQDSPLKPEKIIPDRQDRSVDVYIQYSALLDELYKFALSSPSSDVLNFLDKVPGLVTDSTPIVDSWLHSLYMIDCKEIEDTMHRNGKFFYKWNNPFWNRHFNLGSTGGGGGDSNKVVWVLSVNPHFAQFLCDKRRAGEFYRDPEPRIVLDYSHIISMIFRSDWLEVPRSRDEVTRLDVILRKCFEAIKPTPLSSFLDPPIIDLLGKLTELQYDIPCLQKAPVPNVDLVWSATRRLLEWIQHQHEMAKQDRRITRSEKIRIRTILGNISVKIYNQILQVHTLDNGGKLIAVADPFLVAISREFTSDTPSVLSPPPTPASEGELVISETLLSLSGIRSSLLGFFTRPDRAQTTMRFSPDVYHTQFAEICLKYCDPSLNDVRDRIWDWRTYPSYSEWRYHLVRARPSDYILDKLGKIPFGPWLAEGLPTGDSETKIKAMHAIIQWVQKVSEDKPEISERWIKILCSLKRLERWKTQRRNNPSPSLPNSPYSPETMEREISFVNDNSSFHAYAY